MLTKEKLKKYQKEKFENFKKINELNINDNEIYIDMKVENLKSIVSEFSLPNKIKLRPEFYESIEKNASFIPLDFPLVLEIYNNNFNASEKILIRKLIKNHFSLITIVKEMELKAIKRKSYFFLICGILCFFILMLSYKLEVLIYLKEILSFIASFSIWEFAELLLFEQDDLKEEIMSYKQLAKIRIVYNKTNSELNKNVL